MCITETAQTFSGGEICRTLTDKLKINIFKADKDNLMQFFFTQFLRAMSFQFYNERLPFHLILKGLLGFFSTCVEITGNS